MHIFVITLILSILADQLDSVLIIGCSGTARISDVYIITTKLASKFKL